MPAGSLNLLIEQGATWVQNLLWQTAEDTPNPIDLTGYTARMHIRRRRSATEIELTLTTENGRITLGGVDGTINLYISAIDTAAITFGTGVYDLELVSGGGIVTRLLQGSVTISKEVTR